MPRFNHDQYWPLQGAHKTLECDLCHAAGYDLPRDCYGCHQADYERTTTPNHRQAGYSTACQDCHLTSHTSWEQAVFNHKFPIESGDHAGFACTRLPPQLQLPRLFLHRLPRPHQE